MIHLKRAMHTASIVPAYCPICRRLAFVVRSEPVGFVFADIAIENWNPHPCFFTKLDIIKSDPIITKILTTSASSNRLPFRWNRNPPNYKNREGAIGVVTKMVTANSGKADLEVVTTNNELLNIKPLFSTDGLTVGTALDTRGKVRIGKGRYRLKHCIIVSYPKDFSDRLTIPTEYCKLVLSSADQEKLEAFVNRLLAFFDQEGVVTLSVSPLSLITKEECVYHRRQIILIPVDKLMKRIFQLPVPDYISLSVQQIRNN